MLFAVCALAIALLLVVMLSLGLQSKTMKRITGVLLLFTGVSGIFLYGYGYTELIGNVVQAAVRTLFSVFCMFLGRNEISAISAVPLLATPWMQIYIYTVHLLALYCTASAVVASLGARLIRSLRLLLARRGDLHVIYGVNADTVAFADRLRGEEKGFIVFVDTGTGSAFDAGILRMGALMIDSDDAAKPTAAFLKRIGMRRGRRRLTLYCLDGNDTDNLRYAEAMLSALRGAGISPEQTALTVLLAEGGVGSVLQASGERYGYGSVTAFERKELLARLAMHAWPLYGTVSFDENARAEEDFEALIIGFGATGQAALRSIVMNGQFEGSRFRAAVISEDLNRRAGGFFKKYAGLTESYDVTFSDMNARSLEAYEFIEKRFTHLNYVAVCTGSEKENAEIAMELSAFLGARGMHPPIVQLNAKGVSRISEEDGLVTTVGLYSPDILCGARQDELAMLLNHKYCENEGRSVKEDWAACDYFSRMSCRAAADYLDVFLHAAGTDRQKAHAEGFAPSEKVMDSLSRTEHLRWCAFHYAMGYRTMPEEVFAERARMYKEQPEANGGMRIGKDAAAKYHACLIPWEELPALAEKERAATGRNVDYYKLDRDNVLLVVDMLKAVGRGEDKRR